nr:reverse transcriptase domain-containing protein [Tanacetum cinerariifolium]
MVRALLLDKKNQSSALSSSSAPVPVKVVEPNYVTCGGTHSYQNCLATSGNVIETTYKRLLLSELTLTCMTLELAYRSVSKPIGIAKDVTVKVGVFHFPANFMVVDFEPDPRVPLILGRCFLKTGQALIDVHKGELTLCIENEAITYNLDQTSRYSANYNQMTANKIDVICEVYSQEVLGFLYTTASGNPSPYDDPIIATTSPTLTPFGDSDFLLFEEGDAFLGLEDDPNSPEFNPFYNDLEGDILLLEAILNSEPLPPLPNYEQCMPSYKKELKVCEAKTVKSSVDEPPEVELKDLPPHLDPWVSSVHCVPKKGGFTIVENEENELIPTRLITGWRGTNTIVSSMVFSGIFKFPLTLVIRRKQRSPVPTERLPIDACLSVCAMHQVRFKVFGNSFENCLSRLDKMLQRCKDTNLSINWEKRNFMVKEGIVLGHKISKKGIEVDRVKVDVIAKLPHPTTVKGAVLGQHHEKHFKPIHYARKAMNDAESNYTMTEKKMLAVVASWFADFANYHAGNFIVKANKLSTFSKLATMDLRGDIMMLISPPRRSLIPISFGPPFTRMPMSLSKTVTRANDKEKFHNIMRCLKTPSKFVKSLTFGALTLWARSCLHGGTNIFSWPSTICRNGLKRKRSPPTTPELFANS